MKAIYLTPLFTLALVWSCETPAWAQSPHKQKAHRPQHRPPPMAQRPNRAKPQFGDPLPGLTRRELEEFLDCKDDFEDTEVESSGLGPIFNNTSCVSCHSSPATGGGSVFNVTRFGQTTNGVFNPPAGLGGSLLQFQAINAALQEVVPPEANVVAQRNSTALFGLGLIEAIPDAQILRNERRRPVDGVLGKVARVADAATGRTLIGRFGWKAQQATLLSFAGTPM